ncbi:MAG TPA: tRNA uracil 4-sulfurtransferase ThiI [Candidatus Acidoferrales bacterium]|nr:tRNA uracil 4-sulfurtransferase ThiI [Candidatus Acidoferrales bacterium]
MHSPVIVAHYHELWLKGRNRKFFLRKLAQALRQSFEGIPVDRIEQPGDRFIVRLGEGASLEAAVERMHRVFGIVYFAVARTVERDIDALCRAAWDEIEPLHFSTFAVRAKRSDKSFAHNTMDIEATVGRYLLENLRAAGRNVSVDLSAPQVTCHVEITPGPALVYARKIPGAGGLPANTGGRMLCLLSGGYDSAVAAYRMMRRGAHLTFAHFYASGGPPGESSLHVARALARRLTLYQFNSKLWRIPFEPIQREIVRFAPEGYRVLLYRRMMMRIAAVLARRDHALALVTGDSLGQVASQTLQNMVAVGDATRLPVFRPLAGTDKLEILALAREIGTYDISSEPFHDCCPMFMPRTPELYATPKAAESAESGLDVNALTQLGVESASAERFHLVGGAVQDVSDDPEAAARMATKASAASACAIELTRD